MKHLLVTTLNTKITYQYRDEENYKKWDFVVIQGVILLNALMPFLFEKEFFIPSEVGFKDLQELPFQEYDHVWHEILDVSSTNDEPTHSIGAEYLLQSFQKANDNSWSHVDVFKRKSML